MSLPSRTYDRIAPHSGIALRNFIDAGVGVVNSNYRGEIKVLLFNHVADDFLVKVGDEVAQIILERIDTP